MASLKVKELFCLGYCGLLFLSGLVLIGTSSYLLFKIFYHYTFIPSGTTGPFFVIFLLGLAHLFITWLGIKGPTREHNFHIILFMIVTLALLVCEFAIGIWSIILWDEVEVGSIDLMTTSFDELTALNYYKKDWNKLQSKLQCCGVNGVGDYNKTDSYPASCFLPVSQVDNISSPLIYPHGCKLPLIKYAKRIMIDGAIIGFLCSVYQGLGIFTFYSFWKTLKQDREDRIRRHIAGQRDNPNANPGSGSPITAATAPPNFSSSSRENTPTRNSANAVSHSPTVTSI